MRNWWTLLPFLVSLFCARELFPLPQVSISTVNSMKAKMLSDGVGIPVDPSTLLLFHPFCNCFEGRISSVTLEDKSIQESVGCVVTVMNNE